MTMMKMMVFCGWWARRTFGDLLNCDLYVSLILVQSKDNILTGPIGEHLLQLRKLSGVLLEQLSDFALVLADAI